MHVNASINTDTVQKSVSILGSTGSIGQSTIDVIRQHPERYSIVALTAQNNVEKLIEQAHLLQPKHAVIGNDAHYDTLKEALAGTSIHVAAGPDALIEAAEQPVDWTMAAIVGAAGLAPTMAAIKQGNQIAFANKECLVCAGELMMQACKQYGATLLPVDSEHNAVFQVLDQSQLDQVEKITLTASGGPFRGKKRVDLTEITPEQAVNHPNWDMGAKISVDSATMMNKGLELIEAYHLFPLEADEIDVVVHPESIIHSLVHYRDGSVLAQLGMPDMRIPISHTLAWPERIANNSPRLDLTQVAKMRFEAPDNDTFPSVNLCREALRVGQAASITINAANEVAVARFLNGEIGFLDITTHIETALANAPTSHTISSVDDVIALDHEVRKITNEIGRP